MFEPGFIQQERAMAEGERRISAEEAERLWSRAAELHGVLAGASIGLAWRSVSESAEESA